MLRRRLFVAVVFFTLVMGVFVTGCTSSSNPMSPSGGTTDPPVTVTALTIRNTVPESPAETTFYYGDSVFVDVSWKITDEDWASSPAATINVCLGQEQGTIITGTCFGKVLQGKTGSLAGVHSVIPNNPPANTTTFTGYIQVFLVRNWSLDSYMEYLDAKTMLNYPLSRLGPVLIGEPIAIPRPIHWKPR